MSTVISNVLLVGSIIYFGFVVFPLWGKDSAETSSASKISRQTSSSTPLFSNGRGAEDGQLPEPTLRSQKNPTLKSDEDPQVQAYRQEKAWAVDRLSQILSDFRRPQKSIGAFAEQIRQTSLDPVVNPQGDDIDGQLFIMRTPNALTGTKNFHAQFFQTGTDGKVFMQHMSFELDGGDGAFSQAQELVRRHFPDLGQPVHQSANYIGWKTFDGFSVWIKVWRQEDLPVLLEDPYTAYSTDDIGSVHVAIEEEIH